MSLAVAIDTSGSTFEYMGDLLSEIAGLVTSFGRYRIRLLQCDCELTFDQVFDIAHPLAPGLLPVNGLGGTSFEPVFELLDAEDRMPLVYLTDGQGPAPTRAAGFPVLWVLTPGGQAPAEWGEVVTLPERRESVTRDGHGR